ncbi:hypothetical protein KAFR_0C01180 [Kazachstania africana CBS 2517]|uniref:Uncharacterized protein n=1 Tax=Kazachstania africana (strain ATCC 22294 / BCRC 22015 / CBS 2517 / CECT 1963 / NBRC 1671 / NRRL Y-8276) TaxID=1071382 RepID=H2ARW3_KAZAF|nr:hypothetical protein KAFR_0C01180 [Kazachstania africana CBS 2517]CCF57113.1 hypothetical protein KAFR_0C01180 [Kazachstania africana CBS 2517]
MDQEERLRLIQLLDSDGPIAEDLVSILQNNVVYFIPRIRSIQMLQKMVSSTFETKTWVNMDPLRLYEMGLGISSWKLEISEPFISLNDFYDIWDKCFMTTRNWTIPKLAILTGLLASKTKFMELQRSFFVDASGNIRRLYERWKAVYFSNVWCQFFRRHENSYETCKPLIVLYSTIASDNDVDLLRNISWDSVTLSLVRVITDYMQSTSQKHDPFLSKNLNFIANALQISLKRTSEQRIFHCICQLKRASMALCYRELQQTFPDASYSTKFYSDILITIVLTLRGSLEARTVLPGIWCSEILSCLYNLNFIALDFGTVGFYSYELIYQICISGITMTREISYYIAFLNFMKNEILMSKVQNKIHNSKILFLLSFLEKTVSMLPALDRGFITSLIDPVSVQYLNSNNKDIREAAHSVMLSLYTAEAHNTNLINWQSENFLNYLMISIDHFLNNSLEERQLLMIFDRICATLPRLQVMNNNILSQCLQMTYSKFLTINSCDSERKKVLLKCIIYQILYLQDNEICEWLDKCLELIKSSSLHPSQQDEVIASMWEMISLSKSDIAIQWWYTHKVQMDCKL